MLAISLTVATSAVSIANECRTVEAEQINAEEHGFTFTLLDAEKSAEMIAFGRYIGTLAPDKPAEQAAQYFRTGINDAGEFYGIGGAVFFHDGCAFKTFYGDIDSVADAWDAWKANGPEANNDE